MAELVGPILDVINFIGSTAGKYLNYQRKFTKHVDDFKQAQEDLQAKDADIRQQLEDQHRFGKKPKQEVERWLKRAEEKLGHAQHVQDKVSKGKYVFRSCLGKFVDESTQELKEVHAEGHFSGSLMVNDPSTTAVTLPTPALIGATAANVREEIYQYLMGDAIGKIGVWGMGGIGKTTIMKDVHNRLLRENKFRKLIWVTATHDFDTRRLQQNIASQLEEHLSDDEDTIVRAGKLLALLRGQGRYVLILDDVWRDFSAEDVGIVVPTSDNGCKLVLTTRSERIVLSMGFKRVQVACLSTEEATKLFLSKLEQDILPNPTLEPLMELLVRECDGLPLAIITIAACMRGVSDPLRWENAIDELRGYIRNIHDMEEKVHRCLKFSYDRLKQRDQDCFLYCALYPEDQEIDKEELIDYWMGEGLIDERGSRKAMESSGHSILQKLEENCLLERVQEAYYSMTNHHRLAREGTHTKMHDVVRDMALNITRGRFMVTAGEQLKEIPNEEEWSEDLEKVSLMCNYITTIPQTMKHSRFPKLTTLLLSQNSLKEIPESFFERFPNLKILDLSENDFRSLPNSISSLEKLTVLSLKSCGNLESLPCLSRLQALKKLDLGRCRSIKEMPEGLEMLVNLRYLSLSGTKFLKEIPNGFFSQLRQLRYLFIRPISTNPEEIRELIRLVVFQGCFANVVELSRYARLRKELYHEYSVWVHPPSFKRYVNFSRPSSKLVQFDGIEIYPGDAIILPDDVQELVLRHCKGVRSLNEIGLRYATDLKICEVYSCDELESVFPSKCDQLETLESLKLERLWGLKVIVGVGEASVGTFSSLKQITIDACFIIKKLFSGGWGLNNLEEMNVWRCRGLEEIIETKGGGGSNNDTIQFAFPKLRVLSLRALPGLKSICGENGMMVCDSLQRIEIEGCPKVKRIPVYLPQVKADHDEGKLSSCISLEEICICPEDWWRSVEWEWEQQPSPNVDVKQLLKPLTRFRTEK